MTFQNIKVKENIFLENIEYYTKGDLKGYINCILSDYRESSEPSYEILFRVHDPENGKDLSLVSCDYGYMLHDDSIINDAEEKLKELCKDYKLI